MDAANTNNIDKKKTSLLRTLKVQFVTWCTDSTSHGIPHIARSQNLFMTIIWTVFVLCSFSYCFYTIVLTFIAYFNYAVVLKISKVQDLPATFPAVTICNLNPFNEMYADTKLNEYLQNIDNGKCFLLNDTYAFAMCLNSSNPNSAYTIFIDQLKRSIANDKNLTDNDRYDIGYWLSSDMLISCEYNKAQCNWLNFTRYWDNQFGNCYTFNRGNDSTEPLKSSVTGEKHGLQIEVVVIPPVNGINFGYKTGIHLIIHNQSQVPFTLNNGINIQPGTETYVSVNREFTNKLGIPYSNCLNDLSNPPNNYAETLFSYFDSLNITYYDQDFCFTMCFQDKLINTCNCSDIVTPIIRDSTYCETTNELQCFNKFSDFFSKSDLNSLCEYACPSQCKTIEYNLGLSTCAFPTLSYARNLQTSDWGKFPYDINDTELIQFCREGFLKVIVSYDNLYYTSVDEVPSMTLNDLLGNLGGQLGLFIGISFLSLVEIIELIVAICITIFNQRKGKFVKIQNNTITPLQAPVQALVPVSISAVESSVIIEKKQEKIKITPKLNSFTKAKKTFHHTFQKNLTGIEEEKIKL